MDKKSLKSKVAASVLGFMKVIFLLFGFFYYLQVLGDILRHFGAGDDAGSIGWGITIGLMCLAGWAMSEQEKA
jgi:hypothetical protein